MPCFHPLAAFKLPGGGIEFARGGHGRDHAKALGAIDIPCGRCVGCSLQRSRDWAIRCVHEAQLHRDNCYVTLTYSPENLPALGSLHYRDFQLFMKRLISHFKKRDIRFYMCGEYGEQLSRPHYHACLFNITFPDLKYYKENKQGNRLYTSQILDKLWGLSDTQNLVGEVTLQSAAYCARYILQKKSGDQADAHYQGRVPEFNRMSLRPGIGAKWLDRYRTDVFPCDYVVSVDGHKDRVPRYYDKRNKDHDEEQLLRVKLAREIAGRDHWSDNTTSRLRVKEVVQNAAIKQLTRDL